MNVAVYCAAAPNSNPDFIQVATDLGHALGEQGYGLVYGGGGTGLMGAVARAAHESGAQVTGILPQFLMDREPPCEAVDTLVMVDDMPFRRQKMIELSQAFVALPGGVGTLDEISEVAAYVKLNLVDAPCILVSVNGFYEGLRMQLDAMVEGGVMPDWARERIVFVSTVDETMEVLARWR